MKYKLLCLALLAALVYSKISSNQTDVDDKTVSSIENKTALADGSVPEANDAFTLEINYLKKQMELTQKKIELIEKLKAFYLGNNETIPSITLEALNQASDIESLYDPRRYYCPSVTNQFSSDHHIPEKSELNILNKIFKKFTIEFTKSIKDIVFLPTKSMQRTPDEVSASSILVFLTSDNEFAVYNLNGNSILNFTAGHTVKTFAVNAFTDEHFIATLGTDNTIRLYNLNINRVRYESAIEDPQQAKKQSRPKFVLEYNTTLEYVYDLETNKIITEEEATSLTSRRDLGFSSISAILGRTAKFLALSDGEGALVLVHRNGTHKGRFVFPNSRLLTIQKFYPNPLYATDKAIGFFNPNLLEIVNPHCDPPGETILKVELDQYSTNHFFVLLQSGDVLFYELKQSGSQCKVVAKRTINSGEYGNPQNLGIYSAKSFLIMQNDKKSTNVVAHNITDVIYAPLEDLEYYNISFHPTTVNNKEVSRSEYVTTRSTFSSSFIGAYLQFENGTSVFTLSELTVPQKPSNDWLSNFRFPIVFVAVFLALGYQFWTKRKKREDDDVMETLSKFGIQEGLKGPKGKRHVGKSLDGLKESLDSLTKQTSQMQDDLGNMSSKILEKAGMRNFNNDYDDDNLQEISTRKY